MKRFILVLFLFLSVSGLFAQEYNVTFEKRYSNCTLQFIEDDNDGMFTIILMEIEYLTIPTMYIISSYDEKLIKNFLFFLRSARIPSSRSSCTFITAAQSSLERYSLPQKPSVSKPDIWSPKKAMAPAS